MPEWSKTWGCTEGRCRWLAFDTSSDTEMILGIPAMGCTEITVH